MCFSKIHLGPFFETSFNPIKYDSSSYLGIKITTPILGRISFFFLGWGGVYRELCRKTSLKSLRLRKLLD